MNKFTDKIYEESITWLLGHHCLECKRLTLSQEELREVAIYFYNLGEEDAKDDKGTGT